MNTQSSEEVKAHHLTHNLSPLKVVVFRVVFIIVLLLMVPLIAMQFTDEVNWQLNDFILMAVLLFTFSICTILMIRKLPKKRVLLSLSAIILFLFVWAELAVGLFS